MRAAVGVISKCPRPGHSKTRLARTLGPEAALRLHRAFLEDELEQLFSPGEWALHLIHDAVVSEEDEALLDALMEPERRLSPQCADLAGDLLASFTALLGDRDRVVIVSADVPHIEASTVRSALALLDDHDLVLGAGPDGGYYLIGLREPHDLFNAVQMGTGQVLASTLALAASMDLAVARVLPMTDIDEAQDLLVLNSVPAGLASRTSAVVAGLERDRVAHQLPTELQIEVTNRCNLKCSACLRTHTELDRAADLDIEGFTHIIGGLPNLQRIAFQLNGEPLLCRDVFEFIRAASDRGIASVMNTNGTLFSASNRRGLLECGLDELRVSLDGATAEVVQEMTGADTLGIVVDGLRTLVRERGDQPIPRISLWSIARRRNVLELPKLVQLASDIGVDEVYVQRLVLTGHGVARAEESVHGRLDDSVLDALKRAEQLADDLGVALRGSGRRPVLESLAENTDENPWLACWRPWRSAVVTANLDVLPCCISSFTRPYSELVLGSLRESSWAEIWNGPRYQALRGGLLCANPLPSCSDCGRAWSY